MRRTVIILVSLVIIFTAALIIFSLYQIPHLEQEIEKTNYLREKEIEPSREKLVPQLIPENPADYGITVLDKNSLPHTQEAWDRVLVPKIKAAKSQMPPEISSKVTQDKVKIKNKIMEVDDAILRCQDILSKEPDNHQIQEKLQRLMMLKSIAVGLSEK